MCTQRDYSIHHTEHYSEAVSIPREVLEELVAKGLPFRSAEIVWHARRCTPGPVAARCRKETETWCSRRHPTRPHRRVKRRQEGTAHLSTAERGREIKIQNCTGIHNCVLTN